MENGDLFIVLLWCGGFRESSFGSPGKKTIPAQEPNNEAGQPASTASWCGGVA